MVGYRMCVMNPSAILQIHIAIPCDASFLRLRNLQVGYTLPAQLTRKAYIQRLRFYASFDNLLTITGYKGMDPEIGSTMGIDKGVYPQARVYTFGLNLTF